MSTKVKTRLVDIARSMNITELEALHAQLDHETVKVLRPDWIRLFETLPRLGRLMALTRNEAVVHECKGQYGSPAWRGPVGLVHHDTIDLRMFTQRWAYLYAVRVQNPRGLLFSFQIFDQHGKAVHKIYLQAESDRALYDELVSSLQIHHPEPPVIIEAEASEAPRALSAQEKAQFHADWDALQDTHEFFGLLQKHRLGRLQALDIAGSDRAHELSSDALQQILLSVRDAKESMMAFVGNPGMIQIFSGRIEQVKRLGDWLNILDPDFNLHVQESGLGRMFAVHKPTRHGPVSSLEVFSRSGDLVLSLFGSRADDEKQAPGWSRLLGALPPL